jgi:hypothetical protein
MRTRALALAAVAALTLLLAGCSGTSSEQSQADAVAGAGAVAGGAPEVAPAEGQPTTDLSAPVQDRQIVRTGYVSMRVDDVSKAAFDVHAMVAKYTGLISSEETSASGDAASSLITAQIPASRLDAFVAEVSKLGRVDSISVNAQDVTSTVVDLDARIKALQTSVDRMQQLLAQAQRIEDILAIETQLATRQAELDSLTAQRKSLGDQVAMSTLTISLQPTAIAMSVDAPGFLSGLSSGWNAFVSLIMVGITAIGFLLPFLLVGLLVLIPIVVVAIRHSRRHQTAPAESESDRALSGSST